MILCWGNGLLWRLILYFARFQNKNKCCRLIAVLYLATLRKSKTYLPDGFWLSGSKCRYVMMHCSLHCNKKYLSDSRQCPVHMGPSDPSYGSHIGAKKLYCLWHVPSVQNGPLFLNASPWLRTCKLDPIMAVYCFFKWKISLYEIRMNQLIRIWKNLSKTFVCGKVSWGYL